MPSILLSPYAGAIVDRYCDLFIHHQADVRYSRKKIMLISDTISVVATIMLSFMLLSTSNLQMWHIYIANCIQSIMNSFQVYLSPVMISKHDVLLLSILSPLFSGQHLWQHLDSWYLQKN